MKKIIQPKKIIQALLLLLPIIFLLNIYCSVPSNLRIPENTAYTLELSPFCSVTGRSEGTLAAANTTHAMLEESNGDVSLNTGSTGEYSLSMKLFDCIPIKTINVTVTPKTYVVPSGSPIGVKLHTKGILIVSISDVTAVGNVQVSPGKAAGLKESDRILAVNGTAVDSAEDFAKLVNQIQGTVTLTIARDEETFDVQVTPALSAEENQYKLGIWVRDSTAGIGTLTFYDPKTSAFGALGHAITDVDTGDVMTVNTGNIIGCKIISATKGESGTPGELTGSFSGKSLGTITANSELGVYGHIEAFDNIYAAEPVEVATRFQIKEGPAVILADVDGNGVAQYMVEIEKVSKSGGINNKGIILKITDPLLMEKTGGIVQGMSGAPILQNNMLIGAVTHVFVNDPQRGYGIFAENMLDMTNKMSN